MKKIHLTVWLLLTITTALFSQTSTRSNIWYFGRNAGIDFNTIPPTPLSDGALNVWEGCATICDTLGEIMIYTDGRRIWNRNHDIIPGATNLGGDDSATQSGIIVPFPNSDSLLYVFSVDEQGGSGGLRYAEVDMTLNGGLGGLVSSSNVLLNRCSEKVTAIPHCNKQDFWLIAHEFGSNNFVVWEISDSGISSSSITSIGSVHSASAVGTIGYMKSSPDGSRLALGVYGGNFFELFDFNNETGEISNLINFTSNQFVNPYGVEFSPDGTRLYMAGTQNNPILFQANLDLPTPQEIQNSVVIVGQGNSSYFGAIQNAPNGKIYVAKDDSDYLSVIHNPNALGTSCNFIEDDFYLGGQEGALGLPNLIPSFFEQEPIIQLSPNIDFCNRIAEIQADTEIEADSIVYQWYFNNDLIPNENSTQIQVDSSGTYAFRAIIYFDCQFNPSEYNQQVDILFPDHLTIADTQLNHPLCGANDGSISIIESGGTSPHQYSFDNGASFQTSGTLSNLASGIYEIVVLDGNGCTSIDTVELVASSAPEIDDIVIVNTSCGQGDGELIISALNGTGQLQYSIDGINYQSGNAFSNLNSGIYTISVLDSFMCSVEITEEIEASTVPSIDITQTIPTTCGQDIGILEVAGNDGIPPYEYSIDGINFQPSGNFPDLSEGTYDIVISDMEGCTNSIQLEVEAEPSPLIIEIDVIQTSCSEDNGAISVIVIGGNNVEYSVDGLNFQSTSSFENLAAGSYEVIIQDINNCQDTQTILIESSELPMAESIETIPNSCSDSNGSIIIETGDENLEFSIDGIDYHQDNIFSNLASGIYTISIRDENDCISTKEVEVVSTSELTISSIESTIASCGESDGSLVIEVIGGTGIPQVALNGGTFQAGFSFEDLPSGEYDIQVIDEEDCLVDTSVVVMQKPCSVYIRNAFSPNDDGMNDLFKIYPHSDFKGEFKVLKIFDRWGSNIFEETNFNPADVGWNGTYKGKPVEIGVYVYLLEYIPEGGNSELLTGDITIIK